MPIDIKKLRELHEKGSPRPWQAEDHKTCTCCTRIWDPLGSLVLAETTCGDWGESYPVLQATSHKPKMETMVYGHIPPANAKANQLLIAAARNALPALLDRIEALESLIKGCEEAQTDKRRLARMDALEKYAHHLDGCALWVADSAGGHWIDHRFDCTCGLDDLLKEE